eukprot:SAG11_NODE_4459_length_1888_cov_1.320291_3_plen_208_part_00
MRAPSPASALAVASQVICLRQAANSAWISAGTSCDALPWSVRTVAGDTVCAMRSSRSDVDLTREESSGGSCCSELAAETSHQCSTAGRSCSRRSSGPRCCCGEARCGDSPRTASYLAERLPAAIAFGKSSAARSHLQPPCWSHSSRTWPGESAMASRSVPYRVSRDCRHGRVSLFLLARRAASASAAARVVSAFLLRRPGPRQAGPG